LVSYYRMMKYIWVLFCARNAHLLDADVSGPINTLLVLQQFSTACKIALVYLVLSGHPYEKAEEPFLSMLANAVTTRAPAALRDGAMRGGALGGDEDQSDVRESLLPGISYIHTNYIASLIRLQDAVNTLEGALDLLRSQGPALRGGGPGVLAFDTIWTPEDTRSLILEALVLARGICTTIQQVSVSIREQIVSDVSPGGGTSSTAGRRRQQERQQEQENEQARREVEKQRRQRAQAAQSSDEEEDGDEAEASQAQEMDDQVASGLLDAPDTTRLEGQVAAAREMRRAAAARTAREERDAENQAAFERRFADTPGSAAHVLWRSRAPSGTVVGLWNNTVPDAADGGEDISFSVKLGSTVGWSDAMDTARSQLEGLQDIMRGPEGGSMPEIQLARVLEILGYVYTLISNAIGDNRGLVESVYSRYQYLCTQAFGATAEDYIRDFARDALVPGGPGGAVAEALREVARGTPSHLLASMIASDAATAAAKLKMETMMEPGITAFQASWRGKRQRKQLQQQQPLPPPPPVAGQEDGSSGVDELIPSLKPTLTEDDADDLVRTYDEMDEDEMLPELKGASLTDQVRAAARLRVLGEEPTPRGRVALAMTGQLNAPLGRRLIGELVCELIEAVRDELPDPPSETQRRILRLCEPTDAAEEKEDQPLANVFGDKPPAGKALSSPIIDDDLPKEVKAFVNRTLGIAIYDGMQALGLILPIPAGQTHPPLSPLGYIAVRWFYLFSMQATEQNPASKLKTTGSAQSPSVKASEAVADSRHSPPAYKVTLPLIPDAPPGTAMCLVLLGLQIVVMYQTVWTGDGPILRAYAEAHAEYGQSPSGGGSTGWWGQRPPGLDTSRLLGKVKPTGGFDEKLYTGTLDILGAMEVQDTDTTPIPLGVYAWNKDNYNALCRLYILMQNMEPYPSYASSAGDADGDVPKIPAEREAAKTTLRGLLNYAPRMPVVNMRANEEVKSTAIRNVINNAAPIDKFIENVRAFASDAEEIIPFPKVPAQGEWETELNGTPAAKRSACAKSMALEWFPVCTRSSTADGQKVCTADKGVSLGAREYEAQQDCMVFSKGVPSRRDGSRPHRYYSGKCVGTGGSLPPPSMVGGGGKSPVSVRSDERDVTTTIRVGMGEGMDNEFSAHYTQSLKTGKETEASYVFRAIVTRISLLAGAFAGTPDPSKLENLLAESDKRRLAALEKAKVASGAQAAGGCENGCRQGVQCSPEAGK